MLELINKQTIARSFGRAAPTYDSVAHFQRQVGQVLLSRMPEIEPARVLDLGCGTGFFLPALQGRYPQAALMGLDLSEEMVNFARAQYSDEKISWLASDGESLPLKSNSIDLVFSSLSIQWCSNLEALFAEIERVLTERGVFVFSTLLDGTLMELKSAWAKVDETQHVNEFSQLQDYQKAIESAGLQVKDLYSELNVLEYSNVSELARELKKLGAHNMTPHRNTHVTGRQRIRRFLSASNAFCLETGGFPASYNTLWGCVSKKRSIVLRNAES